MKASGGGLDDGLLLAEAYPDRIAKARGAPGEFQLASGRGVHLDAGDALARETWLAVGDLGGGSTRDRILLAAPLEEDALLAAFADRLKTEAVLEPDPRGRLKARRVTRLDRLVVEERLIDNPDPAMIARALLGQAKAEGIGALPWGQASRRLRARAAFLRGAGLGEAPDLSDEALTADLDGWLGPLLAGRAALADIPPAALHDALRGRIDWVQMQALDRLEPAGVVQASGARRP